jgi:chromosome segregation ATPase
MLYTDRMDGERTPMEDAEAQLYRRIQELRSRARGLEESEPAAGSEPTADTERGAARPPVADLRTLLSRTESHVDELRSTAAALQARLPAQIESSIERAMAAHGDERRFAELRDLMTGLARQIDQVNRDLLAERLGRVEDLELVVDLISTGMAELRKDAATVSALVERVSARVETVLDRMDQPLHVTVERPQHAGVRDLFTPTDDPTPAGSPGSAGAGL